MTKKTSSLKEKFFVNCPQCGKKVAYYGNEHRPFCSQRCRNYDLQNWAEANYKIPPQYSTDENNEDIW